MSNCSCICIFKVIEDGQQFLNRRNWSISYVIKNYKDAPALESVKDYSAINCQQDNTDFVDNLSYEHNHNKLHIIYRIVRTDIDLL